MLVTSIILDKVYNLGRKNNSVFNNITKKIRKSYKTDLFIEILVMNFMFFIHE